LADSPAAAGQFVARALPNRLLFRQLAILNEILKSKMRIPEGADYDHKVVFKLRQAAFCCKVAHRHQEDARMLVRFSCHLQRRSALCEYALSSACTSGSSPLNRKDSYSRNNRPRADSWRADTAKAEQHGDGRRPIVRALQCNCWLIGGSGGSTKEFSIDRQGSLSCQTAPLEGLHLHPLRGTS
jgi:hypothetical protein